MTASQFDALEYEYIHFRGLYIHKEKERKQKNELIAQSFNAWQLINAKLPKDKKIKWSKYLKMLGLVETPKVSKEDLKKEAEATLAKVDAMIKKATEKKANARR